MSRRQEGERGARKGTADALGEGFDEEEEDDDDNNNINSNNRSDSGRRG